MSDGISQRVVGDLIQGGVDFVTTVPCKQLAGVIDELDKNGSGFIEGKEAIWVGA